jgi:hypothetical protein
MAQPNKNCPKDLFNHYLMLMSDKADMGPQEKLNTEDFLFQTREEENA